MFGPQCTFCNHLNPPASNYCTACGARLLLVACDSCNALNDVTAKRCHQCAAPFPERGIALETRQLSTTRAAGEVDTADGAGCMRQRDVRGIEPGVVVVHVVVNSQ